MEHYFNDFCGNSSLSDQHLNSNGSFPRISSCFQNTFLVWIPCAFFWLFLPNWIFHLKSIKNGLTIRKSYLTRLKYLLNWTLILLMTVNIATLYVISSDEHFDQRAEFVASVIKAATFIAALTVGQLELKKGVVTSGFLFLFWLSMAIISSISLSTQLIEKEEIEDDNHRFNFIYWVLAVAQFVLHCFAEKISITEKGGKGQIPEVYASFPSKLTYWWINSLILLGFKRTLTTDDLWEIKPELKAEKVIPKFEEYWDKEVKDCSRHNERGNNETHSDTDVDEKKLKKPSLLKVLVKLCGKDALMGIFFRCVFDIMQFSNPILLGMLISYIQNKSTEDAWQGYILACLFYINSISTNALCNHNDFNMDVLRMNLRSALINAVFKKSLKMDSKTTKTYTSGEIVNLMSVDVCRTQHINWTIMFCVSVPFRFILCIFLLWNTLGSSIFAGLAIMCLLVPLNTLISKKQRDSHEKLMEHKDLRSKLMSEIINGIKVLKFYAWEPSFEKKITDIRNKELDVMKKLRYLDTSYVLTFSFIPALVAVVVFAIYIFYQDGGNYLDAGKAFVALSLFGNLNWPLIMLPHLITDFIQARVSMDRICKYLQSGEIDPDSVKHEDIEDVAIKVEKCTFSWDRQSNPTLTGIDLEIPKGKLIAVVGQVGAGKSSLLSGLLGEIEKVEGKINITGSVAYVPQQAWIQNATLRDNILFGKQLDKDKYNRVLEACSLTTDLEVLAAGDETEIGEKGINLSGGQKQRVNLARAVYHNADIYFMDDPLSAVDSHVGRHIFKEVVGHEGLLQNKTRVLVTHGVHWLSEVDQIIVMKEGVVSEMGTYDELVNHDGAFAQFLKTYSKREDQNQSEDSEEDNVEQDKVKPATAKETRNKSRRRKMINRSISHFDENDSDGSTSSEETDKDSGYITTDEEDNKQQRSENDAITTKEQKDEKSKEKSGQLIEDEEIEVGEVKLEVFVKYFRAYGYVWVFAIFAVAIINEAISSYKSIFLSNWTEDPLLKNTTMANTTEYKSRNLMYIALYSTFGFGETALDIAYALMVFLRAAIASKQLHSTMLKNILRCPMAFFDTTPVGRIINRFTSDIEKVDHQLPHQIRGFFCQILHAVFTLIVICYNTPVFIAIVIPAVLLYRLVKKYYVPSVRQLERIHSNTRSPVINHFSETLSGTSTIRAYGLQERFIQESQKRVELHLNSQYTLIAAHRWSGFRIECIGNLFVCIAALLVVMSSDISGGMAGLCVVFALEIAGTLNGLVHNSTRFEINAISVERINQYSEKETEAELVKEGKRPHKNWPSAGEISIQNYQTRYRPELDLVLKGITCNIAGGEKVGVVGRTGAGKSSLMSAIFRLIESADGSIEVDRMNIADMGLHDLRSRLTILPQDPVLFSGTLRMNLDPFDDYSNDELWTALEQAHLKKFVSGLSDGLQYECGEGGQNLSVGQRQLVCLARALLHKTKILILDEATAAVDMETDDLIQKTVRTEFKDCTILAIAHRLNTIIDYDKILVLGQGMVLEYDSPEKLLKNKQSVFYGMAKDSNLVQ